MMWNKEDEEWLKKCINNPEKYQIFVDNDDVFVVDTQNDDLEGALYTFSEFGYDMLFHVLRFLKCNVDYV